MRFEDVKVGMRVRHRDGEVGTVSKIDGALIYCDWDDSEQEFWAYAHNIEPIKDLQTHRRPHSRICNQVLDLQGL